MSKISELMSKRELTRTESYEKFISKTIDATDDRETNQKAINKKNQ